MPNNKNRFVAGFLLLAFALLAACGGGGSPSLPPATLLSIKVTPANPTLKLGRSLQLTATGHYSNGADQDLTASVTWSNGATTGGGTISVDPTSGAVTVTGGVAGASATITATSGTISNTSTVTLMPNAFTIAGAGDPLATQQWHLKNTGQTAYADTAGTAGSDINAEPVYSNTAPIDACGVGTGCTGYGVKVAVVDTGLEIVHEDLAANVILNGSWNFNTGTTDPTNTDNTGDHGTGVAGLIASQVYNGMGGMGVAPEASLKGFNALSTPLNVQTAALVDSLGGSARNPNSRDVHVFNQSFGYSYIMPISPKSLIENTLAYGVTNLRGTKGALYIKAAGNGFDDIRDAFGVSYGTCTDANLHGISCENVNVDPENSLPYNIVVSALNADGVKSSYSTTGSAVWVSAPGGEYGANASTSDSGYPAVVFQAAMVTTDQSGCTKGYAQNPKIRGYTSSFDLGTTPNGDTLNASCNYTNGMNGTSSATPVTAGVIALMLEANPVLTWRDVKHILATTSTQVDAAKAPISISLGTGGAYVIEPAWTTNAASIKFHNWYGFGRVNAAAAVAAAKNYAPGSLGTFQNTGWLASGTVNTTIPDDSTAGASSTITVTQPLTIEAVQIKVNIEHWYVGDLTIELTSPAGTRSVLKTTYDGMYNNGAAGFANFRLASNAFYGEASAGVWTLKVVDGWLDTPPANLGTLKSWSLNIYGH